MKNALFHILTAEGVHTEEGFYSEIESLNLSDKELHLSTLWMLRKVITSLTASTYHYVMQNNYNCSIKDYTEEQGATRLIREEKNIKNLIGVDNPILNIQQLK